MGLRIDIDDNSQLYRKKVRNRLCYCGYCPYHDIENIKGSQSRWGKKAAAKTFYATGKGRKRPKRYYANTWYQHFGNYTYKILSV